MWPDGKGGDGDIARPPGGCGGARQDGVSGGRGWEGVRRAREAVRTKGKGEIGSLDHLPMRYVGSSGASSLSSSLESSVLRSSSSSGDPLRRCKTLFLMTILLVR